MKSNYTFHVVATVILGIAVCVQGVLNARHSVQIRELEKRAEANEFEFRAWILSGGQGVVDQGSKQ